MSSGAVALGSEPALIGKIAPFQKWSRLEARQKGLLVQKNLGVCQIDHGQNVARVGAAGASECAPGDSNTYTFNLGISSPVAVYFKSEGQGYNFLSNWAVSNGFRADAAQFSKTTPNSWGLERDAHLVDVEVNGGTGSNPDIHFIVTDARVLDGTAGFPLDPTAILQAFLAPFRDEQGQAVKAIAARLHAVTRLMEERSPDYARVKGYERQTPSFAGFTASWVGGDEGYLRVAYYRRLEDRYSKTEILNPVRPCPPGAPCLPPMPRKVVRTWTWGSEYAVEERYSREGRLLGRRTYPIHTFYRPAAME